ncbi:MAG: TolC family outer membrane protein [Pseudomonadota bacterium]
MGCSEFFRRQGRVWAASGIAVVLGCGAISAPTFGQDMTETLVRTYQNNPTLNAARAELRAVNESVPQALSNWRPNVLVTGSLGQARDDDSSSSNDAENRTPRQAQFSVVQPLYRGGQTVAQTEQAENLVLAQRSILKSVEQSTMLSGATSYLDVWRDQSVLELNINNEEVLRRQLESTQDRFDVGELTRTDVAQAESQLATATANRVAAEGTLAASRAVYQRVVGVYPELLERPLEVSGLTDSEEMTIELAVKNDPDVLAATYNEVAAQKGVRLVLGELYPSLQVRGDLGYQTQLVTDNDESNFGQVLAEVTIPLYQQGQVSSRVREAKQTANQFRIQVEEARLQSRETAIQSWENLISTRAQIVSLKSAVRAASIALDGVREENQVGARTIQDVLDAEQELLDAQVSLVVAERDELVAGYAILGSIGRLTALDLALPVDIYQPEADYKAVRNLWFGLDAPEADD